MMMVPAYQGNNNPSAANQGTGNAMMMPQGAGFANNGQSGMMMQVRDRPAHLG